ncbi:Gfo/Idh/MocA family protein [Botrimarina hoheduenensis]|uniref:Putative oxidoreductase YdgJ n=1 Tax=Botrimarina hoheduenensis TaxID=2528000 RepID=A0A5C5VQA8_9BACT|nr:Gfo/Idh/MocA family oxidoreductase [Botrimarina hoheduenensis]TWT40774.1 putative oxidoreductase YdgJ [Botrimarina hoheduenensis]
MHQRQQIGTTTDCQTAPLEVPSPLDRRQFLGRGFLGTGAAIAAGAFANLHGVGRLSAAGFRSPGERPVFGFIGTGIRYEALIADGVRFGPCAAICDVDGAQLRAAADKLGRVYNDAGLSAPQVDQCEDYRYVLDRPDIDVVVIATPDHWHVKIAVEALHAGKDVYCEKPLTLTIDEGRVIQKAIADTGRVFQVGTQQRSEVDFQIAAGMMREGRIGKVRRVTCGIDDSPSSDALPLCAPPTEMNWNRWLGPAPWVEYRAAEKPSGIGYGGHQPQSRGHVHFRWWYEYAGGKLTDWGAHHVDIALWALNKSDGSIGPFTVEALRAEHPVPFEDGMPTLDDRFNTATSYHLRVTFQDGIELDIVDFSDELKFGNGILFQGDAGRYFVNRGKLTGKPVEDLTDKPLAGDYLKAIYDGPADPNAPSAHMANFMACVKSRQTPISDAASHHRHLTVCHAANIAMRLGRKLTFDPATERFVNDDRANQLIARENRKGYEIAV